MALKLKLDINKMPVALKAVVMLLPSAVISVMVILFLIIPRQSEIKRLNAEITKQESEIAKDTAKAAKITILMTENDKLKRRLEELKLQLPEEKEVSGLLKQVSDLGLKSGLKIVLWKPEQRKDHPSGIVYEVPVTVELSGSYHSLGAFFSSLTRLNRIVNISNIKLGDPKPQRSEAILKITFNATTFSAVPEGEMAAKAAQTEKAAAGKAK